MRRFLTLAWSLLLILALAPPAGLAQTDRRCFAETGFCIEGRLREFWEENGGLPVFGLPIAVQASELIEGQAVPVQWFERHRLELHPEHPRPYDVLLGRLGADRLAQLGRDPTAFPKHDPQPGCRHFPETGQNVCGDVLAAWRASGIEVDGDPAGKGEAESLALFGLPLSGLVSETIASRPSQVQWFERARFELHPEHQPPFAVLLGLLGTEVRDGTAPPTPTLGPSPTPSPATPVPASPYDGVWSVGSSFLDDVRLLVDGGAVRQLTGNIEHGCGFGIDVRFTPEQGRIENGTFFVRAETTAWQVALTGTFGADLTAAGQGDVRVVKAGCRDGFGFKWQGRKLAGPGRSTPLDGAWAGATTRDEPLAFTIVEGTLVAFEITFGPGGACRVRLAPRIFVVDDRMGIRFDNELGTGALGGLFKDDRRVAGSGSFTPRRPECQREGSPNFSWDARKQAG